MIKEISQEVIDLLNKDVLKKGEFTLINLHEYTGLIASEVVCRTFFGENLLT